MHARTSPGATKNASVAIIGLGYVGLPLAIRAASKRIPTIGFDIDEVKIAQLERREAAFLNDDEQDAFTDAEMLRVTSDEGDLRGAYAYIICVPTPVHGNNDPDLGPLESASRIVGRAMSRGSLVVIESTVNPGACEEVVLPILRKESGLEMGEFFFAHCPERINPGDGKWDVSNIPRVLGASDPVSLEKALTLYRSMLSAEIRPMQSIKEAEAVKMVENSFRDINIAFVNELAMSFDRAGIDIVNVINGAATKPFGFTPFYPGCGVGGHCIPVDPYYLIRYARKNGFEHHFLKMARRINNGMPYFTVRILTDELRGQRKRLRGARVALLGLSYKADIPDMRESPALEIRESLEKHDVKLRVYDPYVLHESTVRDLRTAIKDADAVIIATDHAVFRSLTPRQFEECGVKIVIDGRNCLSKESFAGSRVQYRGIGR